MKRQWEYHNEFVDSPSAIGSTHDRRMDELGLQSWELCGCFFDEDSGRYRMFFKRPRKQPTVNDILPPE